MKRMDIWKNVSVLEVTEKRNINSSNVRDICCRVDCLCDTFFSSNI